MIRTPHVWLLFVLAGGWLVACAAAPAPTPTLPPCEVTDQTAVSVTFLDENNEPLDRVQVSYRANGGSWQDLPERVNGQAFIPGGGGAYEVRANKTGYTLGETAVIVPAAIPETCKITTQTITLQLAQAICPNTPAPLTLEVLAPDSASDDAPELVLTAVTPGGNRQTLACQPDGQACQRFALPLDNVGDYQLVLDNLPEFSGLSVNDGLIGYDWLPYEIELRHGTQTRVVSGAGANRLNLNFAVTPDEVGCPLPDLRGLTAVASPDLNSGKPYPPVNIYHDGNLLMTDLGAAECRVRPVITPIDYEVIVPAGTPLADVSLLYWLNGDWQEGVCQVANGRLFCTAEFPIPLLRQPYSVKAVVAGEEHIETQLPFDTLCIVFR